MAPFAATQMLRLCYSYKTQKGYILLPLLDDGSSRVALGSRLGHEMSGDSGPWPATRRSFLLAHLTTSSRP